MPWLHRRVLGEESGALAGARVELMVPLLLGDLHARCSESIAVRVLGAQRASIPAIKRVEDLSRLTRPLAEPGKAPINQVKGGETEADMEDDPVGRKSCPPIT